MKIAYWVSTGLLIALFLFTGSMEISHKGFVVANFHTMGYPDFIMTILGLAKLLAILAFLYPGLPKLKEWAYAGSTFLLIGAFWSHLEVHQAPTPAALGLVFLFFSYFFWLRRRHLMGARQSSQTP